ALPFEDNPLPLSPWAHRLAAPCAPHEEMTAFRTIRSAGIRLSAQVPAPARTLASGSAPGPLSGPVTAESARKATALAGLGHRPPPGRVCGGPCVPSVLGARRGHRAGCGFSANARGGGGGEAGPKQAPPPPGPPPQRRVGGGQGALPAPPRADDDLLGQHVDHPIALADPVRVTVAVGCRVDVLGVPPGAGGAPRLAADHAAAPLQPPAPPITPPLPPAPH